MTRNNPVWSPDSREVAFNSADGLSTRRIDQFGRTTLFGSQVAALEDWTHDGRFLIVKRSAQNISAVPFGEDRTPISLAEFSSMVDEPHVSRDGRWLAYSSNETAQWEVYVQPFMKPAGRVRVSTNGGSQPRWRADGAELFYFALDGALASVDITDPASPGAPRKLFDLAFGSTPSRINTTSRPMGNGFSLLFPRSSRPRD